MGNFISVAVNGEIRSSFSSGEGTKEGEEEHF